VEWKKAADSGAWLEGAEKRLASCGANRLKERFWKGSSNTSLGKPGASLID